MDEVLSFILSEMERLQIDMEYYEDLERTDSFRYICDMEMFSKFYELLRHLHDKGIITLRNGVVDIKINRKKEKENLN